jgi:hypothetical protein
MTGENMVYQGLPPEAWKVPTIGDLFNLNMAVQRVGIKGSCRWQISNFSRAKSDTGYRTADRHRARSTDAYETVTVGINGFGGRGDYLDLVAHPGKLLLKTGDMADNASRRSEVIRRYQGDFHK